MSSALDEFLSEPIQIAGWLNGLFFGRRNAVILDVGACEGEDSIRYSRNYPTANIYAFEPLPENRIRCEANFQAYSTVNCTLVGKALSNRIGFQVLHVSEGTPPERPRGASWRYGNKSSSLLPPKEIATSSPWLEFNSKIQVECTTLHDFLRANNLNTVDLMHIDVQGAELAVCEGAGDLLGSINAIWTEVSWIEAYGGQPKAEEIDQFLKGKGFRRVFEINRGDEGDRLYLNTRSWRCRSLIAYSAARGSLPRARTIAQEFLRNTGPGRRLTIFAWWLLGCRVPAPDAVKQRKLLKCQRLAKARTLIETGTFKGDMAAAARSAFEEVHSIQLSEYYFSRAQKRFSNKQGVKIHFGDSSRELPRLLEICDRPLVLWLDGHYCGGGTERTDVDTPIRAELQAILQRCPGGDALLIDDARLFDGREDYPELETVVQMIRDARPRAQIRVEADIIAAYPI